MPVVAAGVYQRDSSGLILTETTQQFCQRLHGEESAEDFKASQGWPVIQHNGADPSSECMSSEEHDEDAALLSAELTHTSPLQST